MAIIATDSTRFSGVIAREFDPASAYCRDTLVYNGTAITLAVGAVLGSYLNSPTLVAGAVVGSGGGSVGSISIVGNTFLKTGIYTIKFLTATSFQVSEPITGDVIGTGTNAVAFSQNGLTFTVTAAGTAFAIGDTIPLTVAGTVKFKLVEASSTDGSEIARAVVIADVLGLSRPQVTVLNTDVKLLAMTRGPVILKKAGLAFGASVNSTALLNTAYAQLTAAGMIPETSI